MVNVVIHHIIMDILRGRSIYNDEGISVSVENGRISDVKTAEIPPDAPYISQGFFDLQVNGYAGNDYNSPELSAAEIRKIVELLAASGTTRHLATIITGPTKRIESNLRTIAMAIEADSSLAEAIQGIHLEGPYISAEEGARGAHQAKYIHDPDFDEFQGWQEACGNRIKIITLAPERKGALEFIEKVRRGGTVVALGHTGASPQRIREAVEAGARLSTHLGNGSHSMVPRLQNYIWEQLAEDRLHAGIISDGYHLPAAVVKVIARTKGLQRLILVSDVAVMGGKEPGVYQWDGIAVRVYEDGHLGLADAEFLAGAGHLLDRCIAQFVRFTGVRLSEAIKLCTTNPAQFLGLQPVGKGFAAGIPADLTLFRWKPGADKLEVETTVLNGAVLYADSKAVKSNVEKPQE
jgi:N-acetylglucosamine-6-phosphate deacetylase